MKNIIYLLIAVLVISCSPERKLSRLITRHPELRRMDTIRIQDTTIIPGIRVDTVIQHSALKDTVVINKEKLKLQLVEVNDTIYVNATQEPDTVIVKKEIPVERIVYKEPEKWYRIALNYLEYNFIFPIIVVLILVVIILRMIVGRKNNH